MQLSLVVAIGENNEIGAAGNLLWHLPKDMAHFKEITIGHHVLMGRKTYQSIPEKYRPLKSRVNIVVSSSSTFDEVVNVSTLEDGIRFAKDNGEDELMIIGGGQIYAAAFPLAEKIYLTKVCAAFPEADTFFPELDDNWQIVKKSTIPADEANLFTMEFCEYSRKQ